MIFFYKFNKFNLILTEIINCFLRINKIMKKYKLFTKGHKNDSRI